MNAAFTPRILACTVVLALAAGFAQNTSPGALRWAEGAANATSEVKNDMKIEGLKTDDFHIFVGLSEVKETEYNRVWVHVTNNSKAAVDFNPLSAALLKGDKSVRAEATDKAANAIQKTGEAKSQDMSSAHCPNMIATACQPNNAQLQVAKQILAFSSLQAQWVRDNGIKQQTLAPGQDAEGSIMFKKDKKPADYILRVPVGSQIFEFPLSAQNKAPSYQ